MTLISCQRRSGMVWVFCLIVWSLAVISPLFIDVGCNANHLYAEGGSFPVLDSDSSSSANDRVTYGQPIFLDNDFQLPNQQQYQPKFAPSLEQMVEEQRRRRLSNIIAQLRDDGQFNEQEIADGPGLFLEEGEANVPIERPLETDALWDGLKEGELESSEMIGENNGKIAAVKKGQNEFVEFVEPSPHKNNRHKEWIDKRVPIDSDRKTHAFNFLTNSGNILFMAYLAVCCFGIVAGAVGGVYYYNHVRTNRIDDPFNEFTRYSPAGPAKDKLKKSGSPVFGQSGDDTLAYKAQLHHYQQQKQKILGTASGPVVENVSDNEEDTDEMDHNYSVFECPGLAPTGDFEIQNPNFVGAEKPAAAGETRRSE